MLKWLLKDFKKRVCNEKGFVLAPLVAGAGAIGTTALGLGALGLGLFGKKKKSVDDPLAPIREQLLSLAQTGLPVEEMKKQITERYAEARTKGLEDIAEEVYAAKQAPGSIHSKLVSEFLEKLTRGEEEAMLGADIAQKKFQLQALTGVGGMTFPEEEPDLLEKYLPMAGELAGTYLGQRGYVTDIEELLEKYRKKPLEEKSGITLTTEPRLTYEEFAKLR